MRYATVQIDAEQTFYESHNSCLLSAKTRRSSASHKQVTYSIFINNNSCCCCSCSCSSSSSNKITFQSKAAPPRTGYTDTLFRSHDLHLDLMTLIDELDLNILKIYLQTKNELSRSKRSKALSIADRQTDRQTDTDRCD